MLGVGKHGETLEDVVVYGDLYSSNKFKECSLWIRPHTSLNWFVTAESRKVPHFEKIEKRQNVQIIVRFVFFHSKIIKILCYPQV